MKKKIFIIAGERSGDLLGAKILKQIDKTEFDIHGIGGQLMEHEGLKSIFPMEDLSVMGIFEVLPKLFRILTRIKETIRYIEKLQPDVILTIDSPDFSFRVIKAINKIDVENKIKKVHFIAPSVWAYRKKRAQKIAKLYNLLFCILPFEPPYFEKHGLKTIFVGHPIFDNNSFYKDKINYNENSNILSFTVGSRRGEVNRLLPITIEIINKLKQKYKYEYYILATDFTYNIITNYLNNKNINYIKVIKNDKDKNNIINNSLLAIAKSGTNTLEISARNIPLIVMYKFNFLTNLIAKYIRKKSSTKYATIINIINNEQIIPEYLLDNCKSDKIVLEIEKFINNKQLRLEQIKKNISTLKILGYGENNSSSEKIVNEIKALLND